jgi:hypothetical protein
MYTAAEPTYAAFLQGEESGKTGPFMYVQATIGPDGGISPQALRLLPQQHITVL